MTGAWQLNGTLDRVFECPAPIWGSDAYFDRINWRGRTDPTFETLAGLLRAHAWRQGGVI
jgi:hypothetical protein